MCTEAVAAVAAAGKDGLSDTNHFVLYLSMSLILKCHAEQPGLEAKLRSAPMPDALAFCLENPLDCCAEVNYTTDSVASMLICRVFGRDEGESSFSFTQQQVDDLISRWSQVVRAENFYAVYKPDASAIFALDLCVSDTNKRLLLRNESFIPYLIDALLIDPTHPRAGLDHDTKAFCQEMHAECAQCLAI